MLTIVALLVAVGFVTVGVAVTAALTWLVVLLQRRSSAPRRSVRLVPAPQH